MNIWLWPYKTENCKDR